MKLDLFSSHDSVLLLGEGNFSFAVCLLKHQLPIKIVATCFEQEILYKQTQENLEYLKSNNVPVFLNVDATKLHENPNFSGRYFSKVVFNFPHVGGKMKIHLNKELLRKLFESVSHVVEDDGSVIISLCQGQGGTPADEPQRRWDDSWQITEMAAHGNFILISVEPFIFENFKDYTCIGYRSQDVKFNLGGALVHVFKKGKPLYDCICEEAVIKRMELVPLLKDSFVFLPVIYHELYSNNPLLNADSPISFLKDIIVKDLKESNTKLKMFTDDDIPVYVESDEGVKCLVNNQNIYSLRCNPIQILGTFCRLANYCVNDEIIVFPGMYFNPKLGGDFTSKPPIQFQFLILGKNLLKPIQNHICNLISIFKEENLVCFSKESELSENFNNTDPFVVDRETTIICLNKETEESFKAAHIYYLQCSGFLFEICVMDADESCKNFFRIKNWREVWAEKNKVVMLNDEKPILKQTLLYPLQYKFDITLRFKTTEDYSLDEMYRILWLAAGQIIEEVNLVNEYVSDKGWSSKCYRITYKSLDRPLCRSKAIDIHSKVVARMLELGLNVAIG